MASQLFFVPRPPVRVYANELHANELHAIEPARATGLSLARSLARPAGRPSILGILINGALLQELIRSGGLSFSSWHSNFVAFRFLFVIRPRIDDRWSRSFSRFLT